MRLRLALVRGQRGRPGGNGGYLMQGELKLKGVTLPVTLKLQAADSPS